MADNKKGKGKKHIDHDEKKISESGSKKSNISNDFLEELKWAFDDFAKISDESKRVELYGNKEYLEQFWEYFKQERPDLLDKIDKKDLPAYVKAIENKWFSIANITKNASKLNEEFRAEDTETHAIQQSLSGLQKFCKDKINNVPDGTFKKFADEMWFTHDKLAISPDGKIKTIDGLPGLWKKFLENEGIKLGDTSAEEAERILTPDYNPTERAMVTIALTKIRKELKWGLRAAFDAQFPLPVDIFSSYQDLLSFKTEWTHFLDDHAAEIDKPLAKKLDSVIVTNGDIQKEFLKSSRKFDSAKWFSEWEQYFRRTFNKFVTRYLFEEVHETQKTIDHYLGVMGDAFKEFPPYVNEIFKIYPFNDKVISAIDTSLHADLAHLDAQIAECNNAYNSASEKEKEELRKKMKALKQEMEYRRWQAYITFLKTKDAALAEVFFHLVGSKFNFSVLSPDQQQVIVDALIKNKLEDTIKNKVPELLSVKEEELTQFVHDLFDLKKMSITIPTKLSGPVPITFLKKEFLSSARQSLPGVKDLMLDSDGSAMKNLPLNFLTQLTESNAAFFEDSPIFDSLYTPFKAKNGNIKFNEAYKVKIKKDGKTVEGYLSAYCPLDEYNNEDRNGKELYLYSQPITAPNQERDLINRPHDEGKTAIPVVIKDGEQQECDMEILDKKLNLNGDAFGALLFGYVLGQQSMNTTISPEQEKALAEKLGKLNVYKEKEEWEEEEIVEPVTEKDESKVENSEYQKFKNKWKELKWYSFAEEKYKKNDGFVQGTRLFIPFAGSEVPPLENGNAWMQMEIINVDENKWTFKVKIHGGELHLGKADWAVKEMPINTASIDSIEKAFGSKIYKLPDISHVSFDQQMNTLTSWSFGGDFSKEDVEKYFWSVKLDWSKFAFTLWNYVGKEVTHFGVYQPKAIGESLDSEGGKNILYKVKPNANGTITVSGDSMDSNYAKNYPARDMDYTTFILFIKEKWLQPKCAEQIKAIDVQAKEDQEVPTTVRGFSINNVISFFKNGANKIKDSVKKYDEERADDLTDILTSQGKLWSNIWWLLSPFSRISTAFESMGADAYLERDTRIWKKVEKRTKIYEDFDYSRLYTDVIMPMLTWKVKIVPHYKIAAILLVHLKKWKWPYAKTLPIADGMWIGKILGSDHQKRYLDIREKKIRDLEQNAHLYPIQWADNIKDELVQLEMRYIVHVMDGRQMWLGDEVKWQFQDKYSKKFCDDLETAYTWFYDHKTVEEWYTKAQDANFEFARVEYFRLLADRPQQALPFLKTMAMKAINDTQWQVFETSVLAGVLSGVFINMTYSTTQSYIQKICRTRWFIPWIFAKDIKQQYKTQRLLDLFSGGEFSKETKYNPASLSLRDNTWSKSFIENFVTRIEKWSNRNKLSKFLELTWANVDGKTLLDLHSDPQTSAPDKLLLEEYINKTNEKNEDLDTDVQKNTSSLTGSILTKSHSVVDHMIQFDTWGFKGATWDAKEDMKRFSEKMQEAIPKWPVSSQEQVEFFLGKFFNRFGEKFSWNKKTELLKRLKWCKENKWKPEVENILYYSIVWEIVSVLAPNNASPPDQLEWALWAWKNFFRDNLDTILQPSMLMGSFGGASYKDDYNTAQPKLEPRGNCINLLDRDLKQAYVISLPPDQRKLVNQNFTRLKSDKNYLNFPLYDIADRLYRNCGITNRFRTSVNTVSQTPHISKKTTAKATWAKIRNTDTLEKVRQILEGKQIEETNPDEDIFMEDDYDYPMAA